MRGPNSFNFSNKIQYKLTRIEDLEIPKPHKETTEKYNCLIKIVLDLDRQKQIILNH